MADSQEAQLLDFVRRRVLRGQRRSLDAGTPLFASKLIDSINILYLIGYVEKRLGRRLNDKELVMSNFRTVDAIINAFFRD